MVYVNNREVMDWQKTIMNEGILSFKSPIEPKIKYTIAFCSLHKDPKNPWFVMAKTTKIGCKNLNLERLELKDLVNLLDNFRS